MSTSKKPSTFDIEVLATTGDFVNKASDIDKKAALTQGARLVGAGVQIVVNTAKYEINPDAKQSLENLKKLENPGANKAQR